MYVCIYIFLSLLVYVCMSFSRSVSLCVSVYVCMSFSPSVSLCVSMYVCMYVFLFLPLSLCLSLSRSMYVCMSFSPSFPLSLSLSLSLYIYIISETPAVVTFLYPDDRGWVRTLDHRIMSRVFYHCATNNVILLNGLSM